MPTISPDRVFWNAMIYGAALAAALAIAAALSPQQIAEAPQDAIATDARLAQTKSK